MANDLVPYSQALSDPATTASSLESTDVIAIAREDSARPTGFKSMVTRLLTLAKKIVSGIDYSTELTETDAKTITGAINEVAQNSGSVDITTAINTPASVQSFNDGGDNIPLKSLVTAIVPDQAGSGVPSPSNPRAISGHSDCTVTVSDGDSISRNTTIPLGQTVYGGSLECVEGKGQATLKGVDMGDLTYTYDSANTRMVVSIPDYISSGTRLTPFVCSCFQTIDDGRPLVNVPNNSVYSGNVGNVQVYFQTTDYTDPAAFKTAMTGQTLVYPITPASMSVTGANIPTLSGLNNVYTDCGDIQSLEYFNENGDDIASMVRLMTRT